MLKYRSWQSGCRGKGICGVRDNIHIENAEEKWINGQCAPEAANIIFHPSRVAAMEPVKKVGALESIKGFHAVG